MATLVPDPQPIICLVHHVGRDDIVVVDSHEPVARPLLFASVANGLATFILALGLGLAALSLAPLVIGYRPVALASGSMAPSLRVGDVVLTNPNAETVVGSVIDYRTESGSQMHRVIEVVDTGYRTKGDSNQSPDHHIVSEEDVLGVGVFVVPFAGLPRQWFERDQWLNLMALVALFALCATVVGLTNYRLATQRPDAIAPA